MSKPHIELLIENESGQDVVAYPFVNANHVSLSNGMNIGEMIDGDVSMPTVTHDTTAINVGVGDSDVSSSIVDSAVNMTIKGQTYQNILPDPTLRNEMQGKSMQRLNEGYDSVETVDGVSKSAILKGQTLVNVLGTNPRNSGNKTWSDLVTIDGLVTDVYSENYRIKDTDTTMILQPSTYLIQFKTVSFEGSATIYTRTQMVNGSSVIHEEYLNHKKINSTGVTRMKITTTKECNRVGIYFNANNDCRATITEAMIIEYVDGMESWNIPYFEGMTSCKMPILKTVGKNLFPPLTEYDDITKNVTGSEYELTENKMIWNSEKIYTPSLGYYFNLKPNTKYTFSCNKEGNPEVVVFDRHSIEWGTNNWIATMNDIETTIDGRKICNFTTRSDGKICIRLSNATGYTVGCWIENCSLTEFTDNNAHVYEPHKTNILSCQLAPLNQSMFEQGTFAESTPPNTQSYESIKLGSEHLYTTRIRTKSTYKVVRGATYEVQLNEGYGIYICYCKNGLYSATINRWLDGTRFTFTVPNDCDEMFFAIRKTDNTVISPSDYPLIGLKIHQEVVLRSLPNSVRDTLNLNTGEYVQRIGETILTEVAGLSNGSFITETHETYIQSISGVVNPNTMICDKLPVNGYPYSAESMECICINSAGNQIAVRVAKSRYASYGSFNEYLAENPITIQYELATPVVKTVDLSSHGNWEKVVLDGSETGWSNSYNEWANKVFCLNNSYLTNVIKPANTKDTYVMCDKLRACGIGWLCEELGRTGIALHNWSSGYLQIAIKGVNTVDELKQYLSQNPITVWYQTTTTQDNSIREMLSFANGHLQVSSEVENSLLPSVQYEIPTKNSYHMDLMKANTTYTMKLASGNGSINKWDGEAIGFMLSRTFNSGTLPKGNLFYTTGWVNDLMILEGDLNAKTIPYFKGIKSAFEGEDKIEVLSTGKNLFDIDKYALDNNLTRVGEDGLYINRVSANLGTVDIQYKKKTQYVVGYQSYELLTTNDNWTPTIQFKYSDGTQEQLYLHTDNRKVSNVNKDVVEINIQNPWANVTANVYGIYVEEFPSDTTYEPHKSNTTKIPLLSPLRSLPNGVCDELIINRMKKKATLIQRIKTVTLDGSSDERWTGYNDDSARVTQGFYHNVSDLVIARANVNLYCDTLQPNINAIHSRDGRGVGTHNDGSNNRNIRLCLLKNELIPYGFSEPLKTNENVLRKWLQDNPTTVCYELATPVVTEVDLEGFPYIYKDGHIFLNSDIAPTTQITYSINQAQQIESANENLQRHEKEISHLQKLIAQYIQVEYESTLLSLKI